MNKIKKDFQFVDYVNKVMNYNNYDSIKQYLIDYYTVCYEFGIPEKIKSYIIDKELPKYSDFDKNLAIIELIHKNFSAKKYNLCHNRIFKNVISCIPDEELYYFKGKSKRRTTHNEVLWILKAICSAILKNNYRKTLLVDKYFLNDKTKAHFKKDNSRSLDKNKYAHIKSLLNKYGLVHVIYESSNSSTKKYTNFLIGNNNPLYMIEGVPSIIKDSKKDNLTTTERRLGKSLQQIEDLKKQLEMSVKSSKTVVEYRSCSFTDYPEFIGSPTSVPVYAGSILN
ncbi:MAG: hypothetical protein KAX49_12945 [Halanaerobiales bacterium]|nr:hypothetical protein [Halanaerobiales bacterium]